MTVPEITARGWYKSSYSAQANDCVETGHLVAGGMAVRDSKDPEGPALAFPTGAWQTFVACVHTEGLAADC
ncbi:DUF397 domain-containing protein [Kitasatospora sp. NBC_01287]|uniref:DUF397 domain-containing protein n=1 Tax=Kitasatospora sp. NBC_01287 TaxID=2903573 RepID=UPI0022573290|nr:DUF397 domain-containing protein [Kitasatospora sp. NBC_01287]MCX4744986.1 DUF397 domain-containing protein [Kitasatospora sp. NBC_01287]